MYAYLTTIIINNIYVQYVACLEIISRHTTYCTYILLIMIVVKYAFVRIHTYTMLTINNFSYYRLANVYKKKGGYICG